MLLFLSNEEFERCSNNASLVAEKADFFIRDLHYQLETVKAQADAASITAEQTCALLEQKNISLSFDFSKLEAQNAQHSANLKQRLSELAENVYIVGGHISDNKGKGNLFTIRSNKYAEFNMFLDPLAAKRVVDSEVNITFIPLSTQQKVTSFPAILKALKQTKKTPEAVLTRRLLSRLYHLQQKHERYCHMSIFLGEILGAVILANDHLLNPTMQVKPVTVLATGDVSEDGQIVIDRNHGKLVNILENLDLEAYYDHFSNLLGSKTQSAVIGSFFDQKRIWSRPNKTESGHIRAL